MTGTALATVAEQGETAVASSLAEADVVIESGGVAVTSTVSGIGVEMRTEAPTSSPTPAPTLVPKGEGGHVVPTPLPAEAAETPTGAADEPSGSSGSNIFAFGGLLIVALLSFLLCAYASKMRVVNLSDDKGKSIKEAEEHVAIEVGESAQLSADWMEDADNVHSFIGSLGHTDLGSIFAHTDTVDSFIGRLGNADLGSIFAHAQSKDAS
jgi:hypothetical protein